MEITFGKFKGWDTEDLAKAGEAGRGYLAWGASNLRSPMWAREFERALRLDTGYDERLMAQAIASSESDVCFEDALIYAREQLAMIAEDEAEDARLEKLGEALIAEYAPKLGVEADKLRGLAHRFQWGEWDGRVSPRNFSTRRKYDLFVEFMTKWDNR